MVLILSQLVNSHHGPAEPLIWTGTEQRHNLVPEGTLAIVGDALSYIIGTNLSHKGTTNIQQQLRFRTPVYFRRHAIKLVLKV